MASIELEERLAKEMAEAAEALDRVTVTAREAGHLDTTPMIRGVVRTAEGLRDLLRIMSEAGLEVVARYKRRQ